MRRNNDDHANYVMFRPATMNHAGTAGQSSSCHSGAYVSEGALARPLNRIPTTLATAWNLGDTCHIQGDFKGTPNKCKTCHNGGYTKWNALGKPKGYPITTASRDQRYSTKTFSK